MKEKALLTLLGAATTVVAAVASPGLPARRAAAAPAGTFKTESPRRVAMNAPEGSLNASFSIRGGVSEAATWSENFDNGMPAGWASDNKSYVTWSTKRIYEPGNERSFSNIDPDDVASLHVDGPYQTFRRETSSITSAPVAIGNNATLRFYVGFSLNYEDTSSLMLEVSDDNFATTDTLWFSREVEGEKPWAWRPFAIPMETFGGKTVKFRWTYGPGTSDLFNTGGYLGEYAIDGLCLMASTEVENIEVLTGETIEFVDISAGEPTAWSWSFPGAVPAESMERNPSVYYTADGAYDVSLTVTDAAGHTSTSTRTAFVKVTGTEPVAHIGLPATFRLNTNRLPLVAPLGNITFTDRSTGFPTEWNWTMVNPDKTEVNFATETFDFGTNYLHDHHVKLEVANSHGTSSAEEDFTAEYSGLITNLEPGRSLISYFDLEGRGEFPGTNRMGITAYAEKFSAPSRPVMVDGVYVYFTRAEAKHISDQIANIGVHICESDNGVPGKRLDSMWWSVFELDLPQTSTEVVGTAFPFTESPIVRDEFFIVIDGFPEKNDSVAVAMAMAPFNGENNSAYMLKDGKWRAVSDYFPAGANHTHLMVQPSIHHSVMTSLEAEDQRTVHFGADGGIIKHQIFSYMGYEMPETPSHDWFRMVHTPNEMTVDDLEIECDPLPAGMNERRGTLTLTDGATTLDIPVLQDRNTGVSITPAQIEADTNAEYYTLQGIRLQNAPAPGLYLRRQGTSVTKVLVK